jgi:hypothetical protein
MKPNWTNARLDSLTGTQLKALLLVASDASPDLETMPHNDLLKTAADETTTVQELTRIKDAAKVLAKQAEDGAHREAAQLVYHVAVVAAFVRHGVEISGRPMRRQQAIYERFAATWAGHPIGDLFREAVARTAAPPRTE